jgi:hypothetical protein
MDRILIGTEQSDRLRKLHRLYMFKFVDPLDLDDTLSLLFDFADKYDTELEEFIVMLGGRNDDD